jgi:shikimate kinase
VREAGVRDEIILIGPIGAGKSTAGKLLADALRLPQCAMDDHRWRYYNEIGYDAAFATELADKEGFWALYMYWKEFECHAVERLLSEHRDCVIDFGAGHAVYENTTHLARVRRAIAPFRSVILLLPCPDQAECVSILRKRAGEEDRPGRLDVNAHFVRKMIEQKLATAVVYTKGRAPEETRDAILHIATRAIAR